MKGSEQVEMKSDAQSTSNSSQNVQDRDYPRFDSLDPSLDGGFKIMFMQELPIKIKLMEGIESFNESTNIEPVQIKVMNKVTQCYSHSIILVNPFQKISGKERHLDCIKIELTTEADLFFNFVFEQLSCFFHFLMISANESTFTRMKKKQKWNIDFDQLTITVIKQLLGCQHDPQKYLSLHLIIFQLVFEINKELNGELIVYQTTEFRNMELMRLDFITATQEAIRQSVIFRYNMVKAKVMIATQRITDTLAMIQEKNDSLFEFVKKNTSLIRPKHYISNY